MERMEPGPSKRAKVRMNEKNGRMAHRRIVAGWAIIRNHGRNNNSPSTAFRLQRNERIGEELVGYHQGRVHRQQWHESCNYDRSCRTWNYIYLSGWFVSGTSQTSQLDGMFAQLRARMAIKWMKRTTR